MTGQPLRRLAPAWLMLAGVGVAALWPLTAYAASPIVLPAALAATAAAGLIAWRPEYGLALTLAIVPVANMPVAGTRPLLAAIPALTVGVLAHGVLVAREEQRVRFPGFAVAVLLFCVVSVVSAAQAMDSSLSTSEAFWLLVAAAFMLAVLQTCRTRQQLAAVAFGAVLGLLTAALHGLFQQAAGVASEISFASNGEEVKRIAGAFGHPNQYAGFLAVFMPLAGSVAASRAFSPGLRAVAATALVLALPALSFSYTRGAVVGLVLGSLIWVALVRPRAVVAVVVVVAVTGGLLAPATLRERFESNSGDDVALRQDIWETSFDIYAERPLFGAGLANFGEAYEGIAGGQRTSQRRLLHTQQVIVPPHAQNLYLNVLAEQGTVGFLAFGLLALTAVVATYRAARVRDPLGRAIATGAGAGLMTLAVHSLLEVNLFGERLELSLFALVAICATFVYYDRRREVPASRGGPSGRAGRAPSAPAPSSSPTPS